jgi:signal transduction histidine kinase
VLPSWRETIEIAAPGASQPGTRHRHSLISFFELSKELDYSLNIYDFSDRALFNFMGHLGTSRSVLWLLSPDGTGNLVLLRYHGMGESAAQRLGTQCVETIVDRLLQERRILFREDLAGILTRDDLALLREKDISLFAPLLAPNRLLGIIALGSRIGEARPYENFELEVLQASVEFFAVALQNSVFSQKLQESNRELRQANENLKEMDRVKTEFVSNMHHELRTPVTILRMYSESLLEDLPPDAPGWEHAQIILKQTDKLKNMLENLLDFSELSGNRLEVRCHPGDLSAVLQDYFAQRRNGVALELHEFELDLEPDLRLTLFAERRLRQVLDILLDNAVRFTPQGSRIVLRVRAQPQLRLVRIEIEDNGPGIPEDVLPLLFVPFRQGDGSATREKNGLGLGLALAHRLVQAMGGRLEAQSDIGQGTTMVVLLRTV